MPSFSLVNCCKLTVTACVTAFFPSQPLAQEARGMPLSPDQCFAVRGELTNSRIKMERAKRARVAFLGGSITQANGWRVFTAEMLRKRFPDTKFDFVNAGIASTDTTLALPSPQRPFPCHGEAAAPAPLPSAMNGLELAGFLWRDPPWHG